MVKKPSRTVHIDVYCTGSDIEDEPSSCSSDSLDSPNIVELESNSTPQTVYDSNQLNFQHKRIVDSQDLPRRIVATKQQNFLNNSSYGDLREYLLSQCDSRDEVNESKQMLFEKHVGDISDGRNQMFSKPSRFSISKNRFNLNREQSDDCISSNYPNSSHSTARDLTCSSISSVLNASSSAVPDDLESSWKETDFDNSTKASSICPSDTFDYENKCDRWRIRQMDDIWKDKEKRWKTLSTSIMHDSIEEKEPIDDALQNYEFLLPEITTSFVPTKSHDYIDNPTDANVAGACDSSSIQLKPSFIRGKSMELPVQSFHGRNVRSDQFWHRNDLENVTKRKSPILIPGYTREHLIRAQKFGTVIESIRKPGHHVGPAKNPDCKCEYCRRWFAERGDHFRERAASLDITFIGRSSNRRYTRNY